jgi:hypothetical protein
VLMLDQSVPVRMYILHYRISFGGL